MAKIWINNKINTAINAVYEACQAYYVDGNEIEPSPYGREVLSRQANRIADEVVSFAMVRKSLRSRAYAIVHPLYLD